MLTAKYSNPFRILRKDDIFVADLRLYFVASVLPGSNSPDQPPEASGNLRRPFSFFNTASLQPADSGRVQPIEQLRCTHIRTLSFTQVTRIFQLSTIV